MNRTLLNIVIVLAIGVVLFSTPAVALAVPPLPSSFYGTVKLNATNVPDGTPVQALIKDKIVAYSQTQTYQGDSVYALDVPGDDSGSGAVEGGVEGDTITFKVGGLLAAETAVWHMATNAKLDLSAGSANTALPPQPTVTDLPIQTPIPVVLTQAPMVQSIASPIPPTIAATSAQIVQVNTPQATIYATRTAATYISSQASESVHTPASSPAEAASTPAQTKAILSSNSVTTLNAASETLTGNATSATQKTSSYWILIPAFILIAGLAAFWLLRRSK